MYRLKAMKKLRQQIRVSWFLCGGFEVVSLKVWEKDIKKVVKSFIIIYSLPLER